MRALALTAPGGIDRLELVDCPRPTLRQPTDVLVRMKAAALNRLDLFVVRGLPGVSYQYPHIVGADGAGVVEEVGDSVIDFAPGDRVMINPGISCGSCPTCLAGEESLCDRFELLGEHRTGTAAQYVVVPAANLARVPAAMPWAEAAGFSLATLTAWRMLTTRARLVAGESVLIWGIGGGVAQAALRIVKLLGGRAIVTSGSDEKLEAARALGADVTINHGSEDVVAELRRHTDGRGAAVVVETVGQATFATSLRCLRRGGRLVLCGATSGPALALDARRLFWHQWSLLGSTMGSRREYAEIVALAHEGKLWPTVDQVVPLVDATDAFARLERGEQTGKLVIEVAP